MLLASVEDIRMRLTFDEGTTVDNAIEGALLSTTPILESRLRTKFTRVDGEEEYFQIRKVHSEEFPAPTPFLNSAPNRIRRGGLFANAPLFTLECLLRRGFISETDTTNLKVEAATLIPNFADPNLTWNLREFDDGLDHTFVDTERGMVTIHQLDVSGMFVRITYNGGLTVASDDLYDLTADQNWLKELAILNTLLILNAHPVVRPEGDLDAFMDAVKDDYETIYKDHMRYVPSAARPMTR